MRTFHFFLLLSVILAVAACDRNKVVEETNDVYTDRYTVDDEGRKNGEFRRFFGKDTLAELSHYVHGALDGARNLYYASGKPEIVETWVNDTLHGPYTVYHDNGAVGISGNYTHGTMRGIWKRYYPSGSLIEEVTYDENLENGPFREFYENGNLKARGHYLDGDFEHDTLFMYNEAGILERLMLCNRGICNTIWRLDTAEVGG